ncbi:GFA family protein [Pseudomonas frederiksbergensis]|uniref:GFA family protein n=1 Tax=Pseudomonas sp. B21-015 TaxID=2895473 RepID=UPI002160106F|nr:GFA family protein [Pseudomonas sp. B21-015]MCE6976617.1 GFA family protein [Pseudomonas frederiksbergensis]UVM48180.1 GFA family protein [Pseudomonas sp. B21-015]UVM49151.1 GFA family protein [Pseudomonas sp. B21-015]
MEKTTYSGGCVCGWVRYEALGPAEKPHTCSCKTCQQHTGSLTAVWVEFARDRVKWIGAGGAPSAFRSSDYSSRAFCPKCGSSIGAIDDEPTIALLVGGFDDNDLEALLPLYHSYEDRKPRWWYVSSTDSESK